MFMLFVVGAMAALSIDVVTIYTARSEAQLAADAAALAGARVLANSGVTSNPSTALITAAWNLASAVATQVAEQNQVGGAYLTASEIAIPASAGGAYPNTNPTITVTVQVTTLPTFFARIWGRTNFTVAASATAEAYNPSGANAATGTTVPVAPICVKPWLLPNMDPTGTTAGAAIFNPDGSIVTPTLVDQGWPSGSNASGLQSIDAGTAPAPGQFYAGVIDATDFPVPTQARPACSAGFKDYELAVAGCVQRPIPCGAGATINIDTAAYTSNTGSRNGDTVEAVNCLIHYNGAAGDTDSIDTTVSPTPPFQFLAGNQNPVVSGKDVLVSNSLVTIPVYDSGAGGPPVPPGSASVTVIGFLQVFLNPTSAIMPPTSPGSGAQIPVTIINMVGCGTGATGQPILGNGASPVAVRLITPP